MLKRSQPASVRSGSSWCERFLYQYPSMNGVVYSDYRYRARVCVTIVR